MPLSPPRHPTVTLYIPVSYPLPAILSLTCLTGPSVPHPHDTGPWLGHEGVVVGGATGALFWVNALRLHTPPANALILKNKAGCRDMTVTSRGTATGGLRNAVSKESSTQATWLKRHPHLPREATRPPTPASRTLNLCTGAPDRSGGLQVTGIPTAPPGGALAGARRPPYLLVLRSGRASQPAGVSEKPFSECGGAHAVGTGASRLPTPGVSGVSFSSLCRRPGPSPAGGCLTGR